MKSIIDLSQKGGNDHQVFTIESEYQADFLAVNWDGGSLFLSLEVAREIGRTVEQYDVAKDHEERDIIDDLIDLDARREILRNA